MKLSARSVVMNLNLQQMEDNRAIEMLTEGDFVFAKSMPKIPHWYILEKKSENREEFMDLVKYIFDKGVEEKFFSRTYTYLYHKEWKYWAMTIGDGTWIINRAKA